MNRIPPSERIQQQIDALLKGDLANAEDPISQLLLLGAQRLAQEMLEQEVSVYLGHDQYERRDETTDPAGYRNGYQPAGGLPGAITHMILNAGFIYALRNSVSGLEVKGWSGAIIAAGAIAALTWLINLGLAAVI